MENTTIVIYQKHGPAMYLHICKTGHASAAHAEGIISVEFTRSGHLDFLQASTISRDQTDSSLTIRVLQPPCRMPMLSHLPMKVTVKHL